MDLLAHVGAGPQWQGGVDEVININNTLDQNCSKKQSSPKLDPNNAIKKYLEIVSAICITFSAKL